jgi:uncharacterized membrane protein
VAGLRTAVLFCGALVALVVLSLLGWDADRREDGGKPAGPEARAISDERFARGEISEDEFEQRRRVLEHTTH